jgi:hypothetical protein
METRNLPWKAVEEDDTHCASIENCGGEIIAILNAYNKQDNYKLALVMAAAPEMLAALLKAAADIQRVYRNDVIWPNTRRMMHTAIAKALPERAEEFSFLTRPHPNASGQNFTQFSADSFDATATDPQPPADPPTQIR